MSAGVLDLPIALARELLHRSGALRVVVMLDRDGDMAIVECTRLGPVVVTHGGERRELAHDAAAEVELPELPHVRQVPPFRVNPETGQVAGMLGGLEMLARAVRDVAGLVGGASIVAADFETDRADLPLGLAGRPGEPVVALIGDEEYELDV